MEEYENIPPEIAAQLIKNNECYVVDVRTPEEFASHRIAGAYLLPIQELNERHNEIPRASPRKILIYCEHGVRSVHAVRALAQHGWKNLINMSGGMAHWIEAGLPTASGDAKDAISLAPKCD